MKRKTFCFAISVLVAFSFFYSCASTDLISWKSPDYKGIQMKSFIVIAFVNELGDRKSLEENMVAIFKDKGLNAIASLSLISPTDSLTFDKMEELLDKYKIEGILTVKVTSRKATETYIPPVTTYYTYYSYYWGWWGNSGIYTRPGYYVKSGENIKIESKLFDNASNKLIWQGESQSFDYESMKSLSYDLGYKIYDDWKTYSIVK